MRAMEKSDLPEVARKRANRAATAAAEPVERRGGAKENAELQSTVRTQSREAVSRAQARIREAVTRNRQDKLTALLHHVNIEVLRASFFGLKKTAAPGVDERTWIDYAEHLEANLLSLHIRIHTGAYRALPSRRKYIPKADGRQRPLGIAAIEDKIVQAAVVTVLTPIYKSEFLGFSYGFRPKRRRSIFLGFKHYCATRRDGSGFVLGRKPMAKRMRTKLREIKKQLMATRHNGIDGQGKWLAQVLRGWMAYYAVPMSGSTISAFRHHIIERWHGALIRRSQ